MHLPRPAGWLERASIVADLRYAVRLLARMPVFAVTSILSLAIGIAASTMMFGVADALFFSASPGIRDGARVVDIARTTNGSGDAPLSFAVFLHLRERTRTLAGLAATARNPMPLSLAAGAASERVYAQRVSASFFDVLQVRPARGRFFRADEDRITDPRAVVVLSHRFWRERLHADPGVLERPMRLNGVTFDVIGVAEPGFEGPTIIGTDLWVPTAMGGPLRGEPRAQRPDDLGAAWNDFRAIGRLAPGITREAARAELNALLAGLRANDPSIPESHGIGVDAGGRLPPRARRQIAAFVGLIALLAAALLAIACSNVGGMLLARATTRRHEMATRLALGASRGRLIRQMLVETLVLFGAAGVVALPLTVWLTRALQTFLPATLALPIRFDVPLTARAIAFAAGSTLATGLLFGLAPARHALSTSLSRMFDGRSASGGRDRRRLRHALVVAQVALSLALTITAGLFVRTLQAASRLDTGFRTAGVTVMAIDTSLANVDAAGSLPLVSRLVEALRAVPGIEAVAHARIVPLEGNSASLGGVRLDGPRGTASVPSTDWDVISPDYFRVVGLPIVAGRTFTDEDRDGRPQVAIVNEAFARAAWPGRPAVGQRFWQVRGRDGQDGRALEVVGVAREASYRSIGDAPRPFVYVPFAQQPQSHVELFVKHADGPAPGKELRAAVQGVEPRLPVVRLRSFDEATTVTLLPQRFAAWTAGAVGSIGLFLAALGLYGVVAFLVAQRTREIAIRLALGASPRRVRTLVLAQAARLGTLGALAGLALAWAIGRLVQSQSLLVGVQPSDPLTFGGLALFLGIVLLAASYGPARRAAATDPAAALRAQ